MEETRFYSANENAIEWERGSDRMTVTLSDPVMVNKVKRLAKKFPEIEILAQGPENGGYLYAHLPLAFLRIQQPALRPEVSDEQREVGRQRIAQAREAAKVVRTDVLFEEIPAPNSDQV